MKVLGSLQQVCKHPQMYGTVTNAEVIKVHDTKTGLNRYRYKKRHDAAMKRFDTPIKSGKWKGCTPREMFKQNRNQPFRKNEVAFASNCKKFRCKGMLSRSSVKLNKAYCSKHLQPVAKSAFELKPCKAISKAKSRGSTTSSRGQRKIAGPCHTPVKRVRFATAAPSPMPNCSRTPRKTPVKRVRFATAASPMPNCSRTPRKTPVKRVRFATAAPSPMPNCSRTPRKTPVKRVRFAATPSSQPRRYSRASSVRSHTGGIWDFFTHVGASGVCKNGMVKSVFQCNSCGKQMVYCSRDGPGNLKAHLKTNGCSGKPRQQRSRSVASKNKTPGVARKRKVVVKRQAVEIPQHQLVMIQSSPVKKAKKRSRKSATGPCAGKPKADCHDPCHWKSGPKRQFCSKASGGGGGRRKRKNVVQALSTTSRKRSSSRPSSGRRQQSRKNVDCNELLKEQKINTVRDWKKWQLKNHPDKGGDLELAQRVNNCKDILI
jgi:hypothetical protein